MQNCQGYQVLCQSVHDLKKKKSKTVSFSKDYTIHKRSDLYLGINITKGTDELVFAKAYGEILRVFKLEGWVQSQQTGPVFLGVSQCANCCFFLLNATHNVLSHNESRRKGSFPFILLLEKNLEANAQTANNGYLWVVELGEELTSYSMFLQHLNAFHVHKLHLYFVKELTGSYKFEISKPSRFFLVLPQHSLLSMLFRTKYINHAFSLKPFSLQHLAREPNMLFQLGEEKNWRGGNQSLSAHCQISTLKPETPPPTHQ